MAGSPSGTLEVTLPSETEILMTRMFDAEPRLVFEASTTPEYVRRWSVCGDDYSMPVCEIDLRVGGTYRFVTRGPEGDVPITGVYLAIERPTRLVHTQIYDVAPFNEQPATVTVTFEARGRRTLYTSRIVHMSKAMRDGHLASGVERGAAAVLDRLEQVAQGLAGAA